MDFARQPDLFQDSDPYSKLKEDFGQIFFENNLGNFTDPSNLGFPDFNKSPHFDQFSHKHHDNSQHHALESAPSQNYRNHPHREDPNGFQSYSPIPQNHYPSFTSPSMNGNFPYNAPRQQPYQQEHPRFNDYHAPPSNYYYSNHYDHHAMPSNGYYQGAQDIVDTQPEETLNAMWSNEAAPKPSYNKTEAHSGAYNAPAMKSLTNGFGLYEQEHDDDMYRKRPGFAPIRSQMETAPSTQMNKSQYPVDLNLGKQGISVNVTNKFMPRPFPKSTGRGDGYYDDDDDDENGYGESRTRSTRGLRVLSMRVKEIVIQRKRSSYKEVADALTQELRGKMKARSLKEETRDEQNVKRRVYDALNVLIAAGVIKREGKIVLCDEAPSNRNALGSAPKITSTEDKMKVHMEICEARKKNKAKLEILQELIFKCLAIKNLIKTNKEKVERGIEPKPRNKSGYVNATRIEVAQENASLKPRNEDVIKFPFIVLLSSSAENSMNLNMDTSQRQLAIESKKPFNIFGDIDILLKMGLHYVTREMFNETIPFELQRFVPKYFLAALK